MDEKGCLSILTLLLLSLAVMLTSCGGRGGGEGGIPLPTGPWH